MDCDLLVARKGKGNYRMVSARKCRVAASTLRGTTRAYISRVSIDGELPSSRMALRARLHAPEMARTVVDPAMMAEAHYPRSSQVKSSSGATRPRGDHPDLLAIDPNFSSPHPYAGSGEF